MEFVCLGLVKLSFSYKHVYIYIYIIFDFNLYIISQLFVSDYMYW